MTLKNSTAIMMAITLLVVIMPVLAYAQTVPGEEDPPWVPTRVTGNATLTEAEINQRVYEILSTVEELWSHNERLSGFPSDELARDAIARNDNTINDLLAELDEISPPIIVKEISPEEKERIDLARAALTESDLPILGHGIEPSTGMLRIKIDVNRAESDVEQKIREITGNVPLKIMYKENTATFQASCNPSTEYCDPLIGGSKGQNADPGSYCTISIAAVRNLFWGGTENGIVIPDHCNPSTTQYYQPNNDESSYLVGSETRDGGWYCDCDFIKSDSRTINTNKINTGSSDLVLNGKSDLGVNSWVKMYGASSGTDYGKIVAVDQAEQLGQHTFHHLYHIRYIDYTDGDSGAPIIGYFNNEYGGMNLGADTIDGIDYNFGHEWSFLKSKLGLRD